MKDITAISNEENTQLIVINGDTKRNLKEFFFGNFTQRMIRNARTAVLLVKTDRERNHHPSLKIAHLQPSPLHY